jgi:hypothetical protein
MTASSAYYHPTRKFPRALRQGDRVVDTFAPSRTFDDHSRNYPGSHKFGTVVEGPKLFCHPYGGSTRASTLILIRFDDGFEGWLPDADLERL